MLNKKKYVAIVLFPTLLLTACTPPAETEPDNSVSQSIVLESRDLLESAEEMKDFQYFFVEIEEVSKAKKTLYCFYALNPQVMLSYSPRFTLLGYSSDADLCTGCRFEIISESGGKARYQEILSHTEPLIQELSDKTDKEKAESVRQWIKNNSSYTKNPNNMWDECLYGPIVKGSATCLGFSEAYLYMMNRLHVPCNIVTNEHHAWNEVLYDGEWHDVDLTR